MLSGLLPEQRTAEQSAEGGPGEPEPALEAVPPSPEELRREREEQLLELLPALVRQDDGLVAEVRDDLLSGDAFLRSFTETTDLLEASGIEFAPIRGQEFRQWVVIAPGQRAEVLAAFAAAFRDQPVYADLLGHDVTLRTVLAEELPQAVAALEAVPEEAAEEQAGRSRPRCPSRRRRRWCWSRGCGSTGRW